MSTTTPVLGLTLYDSTTDQVVTFATFRAVWGGTAVTSNFYKIDTAIGTIQTNITGLQNTRGAITVQASYISANYYEATVPLITSYITGMNILLQLDTTSAGTVTLQINALGTKTISKVNSSGSIVNITAGELQADRYYLFTYDGTQWVWVDATSGDQIYVTGGTNGNVVTVGSDLSLVGTTTPSSLLSTTINGATGKTTPADADELGLVDSAASNVLKKLTWANLKATLKTYFDAIYNSNGWRTLSTTLTYSSADSPSFVVSSNTDLTSVLSLGMKVWFQNNSTDFFGIVTAIGAWNGSAQLITLYGGTDYTVANSAITVPYYSTGKAPFGFPVSPSKWSVTLTDTSDRTQASPVAGTYYNLGGLSLSIPIGCWEVDYSLVFNLAIATTQASTRTALSTSSSSVSNDKLSCYFLGYSSSLLRNMHTAKDTITLTSKTTYYLLGFTGTSSVTSIGFLASGTLTPTSVVCKSAYL